MVASFSRSLGKFLKFDERSNDYNTEKLYCALSAVS